MSEHYITCNGGPSPKETGRNKKRALGRGENGFTLAT